MNPFLHGTAVIMLYIVVAAGIMLPARKLIKIPDELFRKILHFVSIIDRVFVKSLFIR